MNVRLHIERLVLEGVDVAPGRHHVLRAAMEAEMAARLAAGGLSRELLGGGALPRVVAPAVELTRSEGPAALGRRIGAAVYGGIGT